MTTYRVEESQAVLQAILESPKGIVIFALDREYRYLAFNENHRRTMRAIWGVEIEVGRNMLELIGREDDRIKAKQNFDRAMAGESFVVIEAYGDERIDRRYYEDVYSPILGAGGEVIGLTLYLTDITEQRRTQLELDGYRKHLEALVQQRTKELESAHAQLLHAQKLESLGVMAGGIAHDFNNLLAVMLGCTDIALHGPEQSSVLLEQIERIRSTVLRARMLTDQLLAYSGRGTLAIKPINVSELVHDMAELLNVTVPKTVVLRRELSEQPTTVEADPAQMQQVIMNLITNAAESITRPAGEVVVRTRAVEADQGMLKRAYTQEPLADGTYVCLEVQDNGCGMTPDVQRMMFDPFFSSKFSGRGLGLAAVLGIVGAHKGAILVESEVNVGTTFQILFPASGRPAEALRVKEEAKLSPKLQSEGAVLVVDDDKLIRDVMAQMLRVVGLPCLQAASGEEALELLRRKPQDIAVVLLDLTMPGMSGTEVLRQLKQIQPAVRVVLMSGFTEDEACLKQMQAEVVGFLHKPFRLNDLLAILRNALI